MKCVAYSTAQTSTKALLWSIRGVDSLSVCIALYRSRLPAWQRLLCFHFYCTRSSSIVTDDVIHAALPLKDERLIVARCARRVWSVVWSPVDIDVLCTRSTEVIRQSITASTDNRICLDHANLLDPFSAQLYPFPIS